MVPAMWAMLGNDDPWLQTAALHALLAHVDDLVPSRASQVKSMLREGDLVKRAMAAMLVVKCFGPAEYPLLKENLDSGIELVQLDAIQALSQVGGERGREYLKAHPPAKCCPEIMRIWRQEVGRKK